MCMYVCIYTYIRTYIRTYIHNIYINICVCDKLLQKYILMKEMAQCYYTVYLIHFDYEMSWKLSFLCDNTDSRNRSSM